MSEIPSEGALYLLVLVAAAPTLAGLAVSFVKWVSSRAVEREDKDKEEVKLRLKDHDERFSRMEKTFEDLRSQNERRFGEVDRSLIELRTEMKAGTSVMESMRGLVQELKSTIDNRFEKQSDFYRLQLKEQMATFAERLEKLEFDLRQDMSRAIADSLRAPKKR